MHQPDLFDGLHAKSRNADPESSHLAADLMERTGCATRQRSLCLEAVVASPGITAAEVAVCTGLERHAPSRRLPELRDAGLVKNGAQRICRATNNTSITWYPA
jgi:hypothetical protein